MDGSDDFRPEAEQRASDPSLADMLRRARAARLGDTPPTTPADGQSARFVPLTTNERHVASVWWLQSVVVFMVGMLIGVLLACGVIQAGMLVRGAPMQGQTTAQHTAPVPPLVPTMPADTPLPATTNTPVPTPTEIPTATTSPASSPPTIDEIVASAQDFYNTQGPDTGAYVFVDATAVQIQSLDATQLTACIAFNIASVASPNTVTGSDTRSFVLEPSSDGTWHIVGMGSAASCSLS